MSLFVHGRLGHFMMNEADDEGGDLGGAEHQESEEETEEEEEQEEGDLVLILDGKEVEDEDAEDAPVDGQPAPNWVKELRKANREDKKRIRELEEQVRAKDTPKQAETIVLGKKPTMEDDDIDWDATKFEEKLEAWHERKRQLDEQAREVERAQTQQQQAWQKQLDGYAAAKGALKFKDVQEAEEVALTSLDVTQQGIIIQGADNSALVVYALGKNPKKAAELAAIKDPIKFAFAIARLEGKLTTQSKKPATTPERTVTGQGRISNPGGDATLDRLRAEAAKSGDMTKVLQYKREQKRKAKG